MRRTEYRRLRERDPVLTAKCPECPGLMDPHSPLDTCVECHLKAEARDDFYTDTEMQTDTDTETQTETEPETDTDAPPRELPDEQMQIDDDADVSDGELRAYEQANDLSQEFAKLERNTISENELLCPVMSIDSTKTGGSVAVQVDIPGRPEETETFIMSRPKVWSRRYEFVRFVEAYGYAASDFEHMIKDDVNVRVSQPEAEGGDYELHVPSRTTRESVGLGAVLWPFKTMWGWLNSGDKIDGILVLAGLSSPIILLLSAIITDEAFDTAQASFDALAGFNIILAMVYFGLIMLAMAAE